MKKLKYLLTIGLVLIAVSVFAQVEIKKSTEKIRIGDKVYFIHSVKSGETVYSLCRVYNISQVELFATNPQIKAGLKAGERIKIPEKAETETKPAKSTPAPVKTDDSQNAEAGQQKIIDTEPIIKHKVKKGDNIESIAQKYNCSVEDILKHNVFLDKNSKLKKGQYITVVPNASSKAKTATVKKLEPAVQKDTATIITDTYQPEIASNADCNINPDSANTLNIALLLPFKTLDINKNTTKDNVNAFDFIEFYEGFLLAVDSLSRKNISVNVTAFDVYDKQTIEKALKSQQFEDAHLVISHAETKNDLDTIAKIASKYKIPVVSPFYHNSDNMTAQNRHFIQVSTPMTYQNEKISSILCNVKENIIVVYEKITDSISYINFMKNLNACAKNVKTYQYIPIKSHNEALRKMFDSKEKNHVFVVSNNQTFVADLLSKLNAISVSSRFDIIVYGSSFWKTFENYLNFDHIHNLNLSMLQQSFIDYNKDEVKNFIGQYRHYYKGDPSHFSFQGYDLGIYFIDRMAKYGKNFMQCIINDDAETLLHTRIKLRRVSNSGGLVNTESLFLKHTKDFNIIAE